MKIYRPLLIIVLSIFAAHTLNAQNTIPKLNKEIYKYVKSVKGTKVDRGECWDLANQALKLTNADWDKAYIYGNKIDPKTDQVFPGDLIQFENVKVQYTEGNTTYTELMVHHTAIVYKVISKTVFEIAHQNTEFSGRNVGFSKLDLNHIIEGDMLFYRPTQDRVSN